MIIQTSIQNAVSICVTSIEKFQNGVPEWSPTKESSIWASDQEIENLMVQWAINLLNYTITELMFLLLYVRIWHDNSLKSDVLCLWHPLTCTVIHKKRERNEVSLKRTMFSSISYQTLPHAFWEYTYSFGDSYVQGTTLNKK